MALGGLLNTSLQATTYYNQWKTFRQHDLSFHEFLRQFSWLMLAMTLIFFWLVGSLFQARAEERTENLEIEATLRSRPSGRGGKHR
jgi:hypothetical protein